MSAGSSHRYRRDRQDLQQHAIRAYAHVLSGIQIGENCNIGGQAFIELAVVLGKNVNLKNRICV